MSVPEAPGKDLPENQYERTRLAWNRTMIVLLVVLGVGGIRIVVLEHIWLGVFAGVMSLVAMIPIASRTAQLRAHRPGAARWQPTVLTFGLSALAVAFLILS
ncbi:MAG: hypothetical protein V9E98_01005 [Candidatus Nanopelagicales bacterium]